MMPYRISLLYRLLGLTLILCLPIGAGARPAIAATHPSYLSLRAHPRLAVIGVGLGNVKLSRRDKKLIRDSRVGFGMNQLLADVLYQTNKFQLIEEKNIQKRELLDDLVKTYWLQGGSPYPEPALQHIAAQLNTSVLAYGQVDKMRFSRSNLSLGLLSRHTQTLRVTIDICLYDVTSRQHLCRKGKGKADQKGKGIIFTFRDDNRFEFTQNAAGIATKQAVDQAVTNLLEQIHFAP